MIAPTVYSPLPADPSLDDRVLAALRQLVRQEVSRITFLACWEYRVHAVSAGPPVVIDCAATVPDLPDLPGLVLRPGPSGCYALPAVGSAVLVRFVGGDPTRPEVVALDSAAEPTAVWLGGASAEFVALASKVAALQDAHNAHTHTVAVAPGPTSTPVLSSALTFGSATVRVKP